MTYFKDVPRTKNLATFLSLSAGRRTAGNSSEIDVWGNAAEEVGPSDLASVGRPWLFRKRRPSSDQPSLSTVCRYRGRDPSVIIIRSE